MDEVQINGAVQTQRGWMHIHGVHFFPTAFTAFFHHSPDDRNIPALGRIGDPDDILASVLVDDGKVDISLIR